MTARYMKIKIRFLVFLLLVVSIVATAYSQQTAPDLILFNGRIFTGDPASKYAEAIAISGNRIIAVGTSGQIKALAGGSTRRVDLQGRVVVPGFNDAHYHLIYKPTGVQLNLSSMDPSWREVLDALTTGAKQAPKGTWIYGTIGAAVPEETQATRFTLDRIAPENPVLLSAWHGHSYIVNSAAMRLLGISEEETDPIGGTFERVTGTKRVTGKYFEYAAWGPYRRLEARTSDADAVNQMRQVADEAIRFGITSIQDMSFQPDRDVQLLRQAQLPIRIRLIKFYATDARGRKAEEFEGLPRHPQSLPLVTVSGMKWILDGTPVERGAAMRAAYKDRAGWEGKLNFSESEMRAMLRESLAMKDQLLVHVVGDRSVESFIAAMETVKGVDWREQRVRLEHGEGLMSDLIPRARQLGVVVVQNPSHMAIRELLFQRFSEETMQQYQPFRSLLSAGIPLALGSDGPLNPFLNIMFAITDPIRPSEAITREQAVEAYTKGSAFAEFAEKEKGTLVPGKLADLAVLSQDIFTVPVGDLPKTQSIMTIVGGRVVYETSEGKRMEAGTVKRVDRIQ
jgi:predicted amidohydrolase YtcJ